MPTPKNHRKPWLPAEDARICAEARKGVPTEKIAKELKRTVAAVESEAVRKGISLKPRDK
jgi:hypothetical protein